MRGGALTRQLRLLSMLESRQGIELDEAAQELGAQRRTVYRDLRVLEESGFPLTSERDGRRARWKILDGYRHRLQLSLTWSELFALVAARKQLEALRGTPFGDGVSSALEKIRSTLPRELAAKLAQMEQLSSAPAGGREYAHRSAVTLALVEAVSARKTVVARYRSTGTESRAERRLDPLHLVVEHDSLYVLARCHRSTSVKTFLLDRFDSARVTEDAFTPPEGFEPAQFLAGSFGMWGAGQRPTTIRFVVTEQVGTYLMEKKIHPSQIAQRRADGTVEVTLSAVPAPPLYGYLCSLGSELLALEPKSAADRVAEIHLRATRTLGERGR